MDKQDGQDKRLAHADTTRRIIGCAMQVINELGSGFLESVYEKAMTVALTDDGCVARRYSSPLTCVFAAEPVGDFVADILVEDRVIVELKAVNSAITGEHEAQVINYLNATGIPVGLLINFGKPKLEFKRFTRTRKKQN